mmetsp:Transcript_61193/g.118007  ORF Transcript_61193/g.118007 Transcript_61193/m.118007 type:complete len:172 (-) Transcript_61193:1007-1522(-)
MPSKEKKPSRKKKRAILLASSPEHALPCARESVIKYGGCCAAFARDDPMSPKKKGFREFLVHLLMMDLTALKHFMNDMVASWTMAQRWKLVWQGRIEGKLEMLQEAHPGKVVNTVAIKGGPQCDWELKQLSDGGEIKNRFPNINLIIFEELDGFGQALKNGNLEALSQGAS